jgi:EAL domain-containing protein (putative c-di-GMP-specific phosphodiesterase class I)
MAELDTAGERQGPMPSGAAGGTMDSAPETPRVEKLDERWLEVWYQPRVNLKRKCLAGAEAFAYLNHPDFGLLAPGAFVCSASDEAVAGGHALVAALQSWPLFDEAGFNLGLATKVRIGTLVELPLNALVARHRPRAERWPGLIVHVSEDEIVRDLKLAREIADRLEACAVRLAIDNFGAGYSSLASLRDIPFVEIRLDRSFVRGCATDPANGAICQTAIDLAHRFGSIAAADGVTSPVDLQALMATGCDFGQGDLIAPAMPQAQFLELLREPVTRPRQEPPREPPAPSAIDKIA